MSPPDERPEGGFGAWLKARRLGWLPWALLAALILFALALHSELWFVVDLLKP